MERAGYPSGQAARLTWAQWLLLEGPWARFVHVEPKAFATGGDFPTTEYPKFRYRCSWCIQHAVLMNMYIPTRGHAALRIGRHSLPGYYYFITVSCVKRERLLEYEAAMAASRTLWELHRCSHLHLLAWVVMPDHLHTILRLDSTDTLATSVARLHSCVAIAANRAQNRIDRFWQGAYYDRMIRDAQQLDNTLNYLIQNPVKAGLVSHCGNYPFWNITELSAMAFVGGPLGPIG
jgi:putative transposase